MNANGFSIQPRSLVLAAALLTTGVASDGCSYALRNTSISNARPPLSELWINPSDLQRRDLFTGEVRLGPRPGERVFEFVREDTTGASPGYDVRDDRGVEWSVKLGVEAQPEVVASRILWAMGFHQPPTFYVRDWHLMRDGKEAGPMPPARFRPSLPDYSVQGGWSWFENPFVGTVPFQGLIAANVLLSNWDFKTSNNKIYERRDRGDAGGPRHLYVVRDLGASLGKSSQPALLRATGFIRSLPGSKNDIEDFESQDFVTLGSDGKPRFGYQGPRRDLLDHVTVEGVLWTCRLMSQISDRQYADAFRAANYPPEITTRYIRRIRQKIDQGLKLADAPRRAALAFP
ncbi:MAG TPA: hypothetical protein VJP86_12720 [Vicinamibacterales bacterium]|nr:hypothetical protein [Vicinamibacterales bacterium]